MAKPGKNDERKKQNKENAAQNLAAKLALKPRRSSKNDSGSKTTLGLSLREAQSKPNAHLQAIVDKKAPGWENADQVLRQRQETAARQRAANQKQAPLPPA